MRRGAELYDLVMAMRFDREAARNAGAWSLLCKIASEFRRIDHRDRDGLSCLLRQTRDGCFGSEADLGEHIGDVRSTLKADVLGV